MSATVSIVIPTYNEVDNIPLLWDGIRRALDGRWDYEVIIVDDNSTDGTAMAVRQLVATDSRVRLLKRPAKLGLGSAVVDGFSVATGDRWVMMDADLSHRPEELPALLSGLSEWDIMVGSRYVVGGGVLNWPVHRRIISRVASAVARRVVGLRLHDVTSGLAAFRREVVEPLLPTLNAMGFKLLLEILARSRTVRVKEVPILFVERQNGKSKCSSREVLTFVRLCLELRGVRRTRHPGAGA